MRLVRVKLVRERSPRYASVNGPGDVVAALLDMYKDEPRERLVVIHMDVQHTPLNYEVVTTGTVDTSVVHPREVFQSAILANAVAIVLAHNHPSGNPTPSADDREVARVIRAAGEILQIPLIDFIITGSHATYCSFREEGLL